MNTSMNTAMQTSANTSTHTCNTHSLSGCHKLPHFVEFMIAEASQKKKALTDKRRQSRRGSSATLPPHGAACNISLQHLAALPRHIHEVQKQQQQTK